MRALGRSFWWNTYVGASGPWPHTRYITEKTGYWLTNVAALEGDSGAAIQAADLVGIINDDLVGGVTQGGDFCLDLVRGGPGATYTRS